MHKRIAITRAASLWGLGIALAVLLAPGCSKGPPMGEVHGIVRLDGAPLANGAISFVPKDKRGMTAGAVIKDGQYAIARVPVTTHRVEIMANIMDPKQPPGTPEDQLRTISLVPKKYNQDSTLSADVQAGKNERNFDLQSK